MSVETERSTAPVPPPGEEVHLPGPTIIPVLSAISITLVVVGTTLTWILSLIGGIGLILTTVRWVRDTRRDVAALPEQHH